MNFRTEESANVELANLAQSPPALVILLLAKASHKLRTVTISPGCAGASSLLPFKVQESLETSLCEDDQARSNESWFHGLGLFSEGTQRTVTTHQCK